LSSAQGGKCEKKAHSTNPFVGKEGRDRTSCRRPTKRREWGANKKKERTL